MEEHPDKYEIETSLDTQYNKRIRRSNIDRKERLCSFCRPNRGCNSKGKRPKRCSYKNKDRTTITEVLDDSIKQP